MSSRNAVSSLMTAIRVLGVEPIGCIGAPFDGGRMPFPCQFCPTDLTCRRRRTTLRSFSPPSVTCDLRGASRMTLRMAEQVGRVPSMVVPLDTEQQARFERLVESI